MCNWFDIEICYKDISGAERKELTFEAFSEIFGKVGQFLCEYCMMSLIKCLSWSIIIFLICFKNNWLPWWETLLIPWTLLWNGPPNNCSRRHSVCCLTAGGGSWLSFLACRGWGMWSPFFMPVETHPLLLWVRCLKCIKLVTLSS